LHNKLNFFELNPSEGKTRSDADPDFSFKNGYGSEEFSP
jgi:hypothetical protein